MTAEFRQLHETIIDLFILMNQPQRDTEILEKAGVELDRALFPLLVGIEKKGPIGVGDLADGVGRDYSTVSRQVAKLEGLGLIQRRSSKIDARVNEAVLTTKGRVMIEKIDLARQESAEQFLKNWDKKDLKDLSKLLRRFVDDLVSSKNS